MSVPRYLSIYLITYYSRPKMQIMNNRMQDGIATHIYTLATQYTVAVLQARKEQSEREGKGEKVKVFHITELNHGNY